MTQGARIKKVGHGQRTIKVQIGFWTDGIASAPKGFIRPKNCWSGGTVRVSGNKDHEIPAQDPVPFNNFSDITDAVRRALDAAGVTMHEMR